MKYLTFWTIQLETRGKNIESKLLEKDKQIDILMKKQEKTEQLIQSLIDFEQLSLDVRLFNNRITQSPHMKKSVCIGGRTSNHDDAHPASPF